MTPLYLESLTAHELKSAIAADPRATTRLLDYLDARGIEHSGVVTSAALASVACSPETTRRSAARTWAKWSSGERAFPIGVRRLLVAICWGTR